MKYYVTIGGRELEVELDGDRVRCDGTEVSAHLLAIPGTPLRQLVVDGRALLLPLTRGEAGRWELSAWGERHEAEVVDARQRHIRSLVGPGAAQRAGGQVRAPMPGLVVRIAVRPGDVVAPGQGLVVLEAMKMENELKATAAGVVQAVRVEPGAAVEKGQVLVDLADAASLEAAAAAPGDGDGGTSPAGGIQDGREGRVGGEA